MRPGDISAVLSIQAEAYISETLETEAIIRERFTSCPDTAWVAEGEGGVCAYLVGYRSTMGKITPLGGDFAPLSQSDSLYLHDLAVSRRANGLGLGPALVEAALQQAHREGLNYSALVSVQGSKGFWERLGYAAAHGLEPDQATNLATYAGPAFYMVKTLL
jgi:predicted N-acetyltransferase YhbS